MKISKTKLIAYCGMVSLLASLILGLMGYPQHQGYRKYQKSIVKKTC